MTYTRRSARHVRGLFLGLGLLTGASAQAQEAVEYYGTDALGSVRVVFNASGAVIARNDYLPFGESWAPFGNLPSPLFTGQQRDGEEGFDYFNARSLHVRTGRFEKVDPAGGSPAAPQSWNRYAYVLNNPLSATDPTGMMAESLFESRMCSAEYSFSQCGGAGLFWGDESVAGGFGNGYATAVQNGYFEGMPSGMWEGLRNFHQRADEAFDLAREVAAAQQSAVHSIIGTATVTTETSIVLPDGSTVASSSQTASMSLHQLTPDELNATIESMIPGSGTIKLGKGVISSVSRHAVERAIQRGVTPDAILDAVRNPIEIGKTTWDKFGRPALPYVGRTATVVVNPSSGAVITLYKTSARKVKRLLNRME